MEFFRDSSFNFMAARRIWLTISAVAVLFAVVDIFVQKSINIGIDFAGGTQLTLTFAEPANVEELRRLIDAEGISEPRIQSIGQAEDNEVLLKTPILEGSEEGSRRLVEAALDRRYNADQGGKLDLNKRGRDAVASLLLQRDPDGQKALGEGEAATYYDGVAEAILESRLERGLILDWSQLQTVPEVTDATLKMLESEAYLGHYAILGAENVGPQIGSELRLKGILAVAFSLVGMMAYIWLRFELRFGIGAIVASAHDVLITLGLYALAGYEFNLTTIAAFLTVVGYSVNDTVVVFDRVRENMRRTRRESLETVLNQSLNQTLSRTVLTSGTTLLVVTTLLLFGGDVIRGFAFVLMVGIVVGTYSSVFIASPIVLIWENLLGREARASRSASHAATAG